MRARTIVTAKGNVQYQPMIIHVYNYQNQPMIIHVKFSISANDNTCTTFKINQWLYMYMYVEEIFFLCQYLQTETPYRKINSNN